MFVAFVFLKQAENIRIILGLGVVRIHINLFFTSYIQICINSGISIFVLAIQIEVGFNIKILLHVE